MTDDREDEFLAALARVPRLRLSEDTKKRHLSALADLSAQPVPALRRSQRLRSRLRRTGVIVLAAVGVFGASLGTAAALGVFTSPTDMDIALCYATANLNEPGNHTEFSVAIADGENPHVHNAANLALEICAEAWRQGRLSITEPHVREPVHAVTVERPVPQLIACVLPSGQVGVFPGSEATCLRLGLHAAIL